MKLVLGNYNIKGDSSRNPRCKGSTDNGPQSKYIQTERSFIWEFEYVFRNTVLIPNAPRLVLHYWLPII